MRGRSVTEIMVLVFTGLIAVTILAAAGTVAVIEIRDPTVDTSGVVDALTSVIAAILGALLGLLAGKSEQLGTRPMTTTRAIYLLAAAAGLAVLLIVGVFGWQIASGVDTTARLSRPSTTAPPVLIPGPPGPPGRPGRDGVDGETVVGPPGSARASRSSGPLVARAGTGSTAKRLSGPLGPRASRSSDPRAPRGSVARPGLASSK